MKEFWLFKWLEGLRGGLPPNPLKGEYGFAFIFDNKTKPPIIFWKKELFFTLTFADKANPCSPFRGLGGKLCLLFLFSPFLLQAQTPPKPKPKIPQNPTQPQTNPADTTNEIINIEWADQFIYEIEELENGQTDTLQRLLGNVELSQDTVYMYCDSARIVNNTNLTAIGKVLMQQGDSISIFADSVIYNSETRVADLYGEVIMDKSGQKLFTDYLNYNMETDVATYYSGATLNKDSIFLQSQKGYYYVNREEIYFKDSVVVVSPEFTLRSDTLLFNTETEIATFLGPTLITQDSSRIYCESGFYDTKNKSAEFRDNPQYVEGEKIALADVIRYDGNKKEVLLEGNARFTEDKRVATADVIRYNEVSEVTLLEGNAVIIDEDQNIVADTVSYDKLNETYATRGRSNIVDGNQILLADQVDYDKEKELGIATGNVIWRDTAEHITIIADQADYRKENDYLKASGGKTGRPLFISEIDGDSLFMVADTLVAVRDTLSEDSTKVMHAYFDVKVYKSDLQAISDSLVYNQTDSIFTFFTNPVVWSDTSQFTADTIRMQLANKKIDKIFLRQNSFIINTENEPFFNQIKGKNSIAYFVEGELDHVLVEGNAESVYYPLDDEKLHIGVNKTVCSKMKIFFGDNEVTGIKFFAKPDAKLTPMAKADHNGLKMEGFNWQIEKRPARPFGESSADLFDEKRVGISKEIDDGIDTPLLDLLDAPPPKKGEVDTPLLDLLDAPPPPPKKGEIDTPLLDLLKEKK